MSAADYFMALCAMFIVLIGVPSIGLLVSPAPNDRTTRIVVAWVLSILTTIIVTLFMAFHVRIV